MTSMMKNRLSYTFLIISFRIVVAILTQIKYNLLFTEIHFQVIEKKQSYKETLFN
jgi:hypothetical protein